MDDRETDRAPPVPKKWQSANQLIRQGYAGNIPTLNRKLETLRTALIGDIVAAGMAESDAVAIVDANLIGRKNPINGREATYASPDAQRLLNLARSNKFDPSCPPAPVGWWTANQLAQAGFKGDPKTIKRKLETLRTALIGDIVAAGMAESDAVAIVDANLIGRKMPRMGPAGIHASLDAISILENNGALQHLWDNESPEPTDQEKNHNGRLR